nr:hypothetical protein [Tanacetum cinerariifolium]
MLGLHSIMAEAVNTACYVQNKVLVNKSQNKTPYELFNGRTPAIGFLKPFGCHVMILNTLDNLGKFKAKGDEGYFIGYSMSSKAFWVFNKRTKRVEENLHVEFLENKAIEQRVGPNWLFDIDSLTKFMNYVPVDAGTNSTNLSGTKDAANQEVKKDESSLRYIVLPYWTHDALLESTSSKPYKESSTQVPEGSGKPNPTAFSSNPPTEQIKTLTVESPIPTVSSPVLTAYLNDSPEPSSEARLNSKRVANQEETPSLDNILSLTNRFEDILGVSTSSDETIGVEAAIAPLVVPKTLSSQKALIDKVPVLPEQHQVLNQFEIPLVESEEDPVIPREIPRENFELWAMINQGVTAALAARDALRSTNGDDSHNSGTCTEGVTSLSQWCERMESVFHISNCAAENQVKFATCTLHFVALTWWNTHVQTVSDEVAYGMTWKTLMKMMTEKYCPRNEIRKLEMELWDLKVKVTDLASYTQRFQELALLCGRMFSEESDKIEKYVGGLPDMIHGSVVASKPKTMQEAIEIATELMDKKIRTFAERETVSKRKFENTSRNTQNQQQHSNKRQNTGRVYTIASGEKKQHGGSKPLYAKCNYHHDGPCAPKCRNYNKISHFACDCKNTANTNNANNQRGIGLGQKTACYECGVQGHFRRECPNLKNNNNHGNQGGRNNALARVYAVGRARTDTDANVIT